MNNYGCVYIEDENRRVYICLLNLSECFETKNPPVSFDRFVLFRDFWVMVFHDVPDWLMSLYFTPKKITLLILCKLPQVEQNAYH